MIDKVLKFIEEYHLSKKTIVVGFSGGYDSMCLLDVMNKLSKRCSIHLIAGHYNHNWRGEIAKQEQLHCEEFCKKNNIEFYTETAPDNVKHNETEARELRYAFFERVCKKYNADAIFTAHNFDDNAETVLYRIIKGTGVIGLRGISKVRGKFFRPILDIPRYDIEKYCVDNCLVPNIDDSNADTVHKRNLIRHEIMPLLEKINPETKKALNNLVKIANSELNIVDEYLEKIYDVLYSQDTIKTDIFMLQSYDVKRKIIYDFIYRSEIDYDSSLIENICNFIEKTISDNKPSKFSLSDTKWLYVDKIRIEMISSQEKNEDVVSIKKEGSYEIAESIFKIEKFDSWFEKQSNENTALVDLSGVSNLVLRTRRDGDIIKPLGFSGTMKLKKYLMSKNIPHHKRDSLVLLCDEGEVLWVAGVGLSDKIKTISKPTHKLSIQYNNEV